MNTQEMVTVPREQMAVVEQLRQLLGSGGISAALQRGERLNLSYVADGWQDPYAPHGRLLSRPRVYSYEEIRTKWLSSQGVQQFDLTLADVHVDTILTNISIGYQNAEYIGPLVFPRVPVTKESGKFFTFDRADALRSEAAIRGIGARYQRTGWDMSTDSYSVDEFGLETPIDDRVRNNADAIMLEQTAVEYVSDQIDLKIEKDVANLINTAANWTGSTTLSGGDQWSDASSDVLASISTARLLVQANAGRRPNTAVLGVQVFEKLSLHPDLIDRIKYTGTAERPSMVTPMMLAALFGVDRVLIGTALENTAVEGATAAYSFVWGKKFWIGYVSPRPAINTPSAGYIFTTGRFADRYREEQTRSDIIRAAEAWDSKTTSAGAGTLYTNAVA
jgi:hypothetical protein